MSRVFGGVVRASGMFFVDLFATFWESSVATGNIRGGRIALGRQGRVYVAWNGSAKLGEPAKGRSPMLFTRLNDAGTAFEPERNLIQTAYGLDGGGGRTPAKEGKGKEQREKGSRQESLVLNGSMQAEQYRPPRP